MSPAAFVIGTGEVGGRIARALEGAGWDVRPVTRDLGWDGAVDASDPAWRIVAVREEALAEVLARFPASLRGRLVLVQNGFLEAVHGDLGPVTRGLIYFTSKGDFFRVLCPSPFHGPAARALGTALTRGGVPAEVLESREAYLDAMVVKGIWNCVVGLPLAVHGVTLGEYRTEFRDELDALADESARAAGAEYGARVRGPDAVRKILETTRDLGWVKGGVKALAWRNGAIAAFGRRHRVPTPVNDRLLERVADQPG